MGDQRRAEKAAGAFFENDHVARLRFELFLDLEGLGIDLYALAVGGVDSSPASLLCGFRWWCKKPEFSASAPARTILASA